MLTELVEETLTPKLRGGYYTPPAIAQFLAEWVIQRPTDTVLEPSCGDGELVEAATTATMYPTVKEADVLGLPFPALSPAVQAGIVRLVQAGFAARKRATELLDEAKRRVEDFIQS